MFRTPRSQPERPSRGHGQEVAEVTVPSHSTHMCEAEALHGGVLVRVAGSIVASGHSVRTQLDQAEGRGGAGKGLALPEFLTGARPNEWIHQIGRVPSFAKTGIFPNR